ncbi:MBOAT-domain-containing protein [Fomitiporia mediterranea MF3/22]|uniref:MBOAT-domain-containing protein n=1 Tax=Fomitiporia mediterranea (strain MF3/22) TaxID=694068 RepID=UPI000440982A|nr:MBOAT-domain-containing protein [Fomitiporia mediterranea MF3/22]EJD00976.1 MBOAT-domain-containing protein [Fomitiporia mediterranea MF3/22]
MDAIFQPLADTLGASVDQVELISCLLISYPLGSVFIRLPAGHHAIKHLFNIGVTMFYLLGMLELWSGAAQLLGSVLATYFIAKNVKSSNMPWIVFFIVMGHLMVNHVIRAMFNLSYETFEVTGPQMVLTMKLTTFAWNVYDGRRPEKELDKWQLEKRVAEYPSLLAFLGYSFYFPGFLIGPYLDFASYTSLVDESLFTTKKGKEKAVTPGGRRVPIGRKRVAYRKMVIGLVFLGMYVTQIGKFSFASSLEDWFAQKSLLYRLVVIQICGFFERTKYYAIWTLTEGASILTGSGFSGYGPNGETVWNDAANVDIMNIEFAPNFKVMLDSWNMKTNVWLRECVYKRVTPKGKKPGFRSSMMTFGTSAFWHGCSGGYYVAFFYGGFVQTVGRLCRNHLRPLLLPPNIGKNDVPPPTLAKRIYDVLGIMCAVACMNYAAMPFMLLTIVDSLKGWRAVGWYGHVLVFGGLAFFYLGGSRYLKGVQMRRVKKVDAGKVKSEEVSGFTTPEPMTLPPVDIALEEVDKKI